MRASATRSKIGIDYIVDTQLLIGRKACSKQGRW
jgi:hypothetical protein